MPRSTDSPAVEALCSASTPATYPGPITRRPFRARSAVDADQAPGQRGEKTRAINPPGFFDAAGRSCGLTMRKPTRGLRRVGALRLRIAQRQYQASEPQSPPRRHRATPLRGPRGFSPGLRA